MELVTAAMGSLLFNLGELLKQACNLQKGVEKDVRLLESELESMHAALLKVAEVPLDQLDEQVKLWARDVRELSYDMEDIVDTFLVRVGDGREATANPNPDSLRRLMEKMGNLFLQGKAHHQIANAIKGISERSQEVADRRKRLKVDDVVATTTPIDPRLRALYAEATELIGIYGKKDEELIKMLSEGDDVSQKKLKTVSVVGLGGLGKTTLARAVKDKIEGDFDFSAFVPVGRNPDMKKVFGELLCDLDKEKYTKEVDLMVLDEGQMIDEVREFLENKRPDKIVGLIATRVGGNYPPSHAPPSSMRQAPKLQSLSPPSRRRYPMQSNTTSASPLLYWPASLGAVGSLWTPAPPSPPPCKSLLPLSSQATAISASCRPGDASTEFKVLMIQPLASWLSATTTTGPRSLQQLHPNW